MSLSLLTFQLRRMQKASATVKDQLNQSFTGKANLGGKLNVPKEHRTDVSIEVLLGEVNKYKQLYENAVRSSSDDGEHKRLLAEVERCKDQSCRAEEKLFAMLEYEVKYKQAKVSQPYFYLEL